MLRFWLFIFLFLFIFELQWRRKWRSREQCLHRHWKEWNMWNLSKKKCSPSLSWMSANWFCLLSVRCLVYHSLIYIYIFNFTFLSILKIANRSFCSFLIPDKFGAAMALVKSDIGGNITVETCSDLWLIEIDFPFFFFS